MFLVFIRRLCVITIAFAFTLYSFAHSARAQSYPIDCAILLCLAGGWPTSGPCTRARAEFIRRITPWPVEPPLQIWRCPMGASYESAPLSNEGNRIWEVLQNATDYHAHRYQSSPVSGVLLSARVAEAALLLSDHTQELVPFDQAVQLVQDRADIDISGPEFNFVRSIRVFDVRFVRQKESDNTGDCNRGERVLLGTYGIQGNFAWQASSTASLPPAHSGLERYGEHCPQIYHQSVFVEWYDYAGRYGFEQVNY